MIVFEQADGLGAVRELWHRLDSADGGGNLRIAWYGQRRAAGMSHAEALADTIEHWGLVHLPWYRHRFPDDVPFIEGAESNPGGG